MCFVWEDLLSKKLEVGAIVTEHGVKDFVNDLQVDLAACCTKDSQDCRDV